MNLAKGVGVIHSLCFCVRLSDMSVKASRQQQQQQQQQKMDSGRFWHIHSCTNDNGFLSG
jgi:hypothetical protein